MTYTKYKTKQSFKGNKARWLQLEYKLEWWVVKQNAASNVTTVTVRMKAAVLHATWTSILFKDKVVLYLGLHLFWE